MAETADLNRSLRHTFEFGLVGWAGFLPVDLYLKVTLYPDASLASMWVWRAASLGLLAIGYLIIRNAWLGRRGEIALTTIVFALTGVFMAEIGRHVGGLSSLYIHGLAFYYSGTAALVPSPWRRGLVLVVPVSVAYVGTMLLFAVVDPTIAATWQQPGAKAAFTLAVFMELALLMFGVLASHFHWASRKQLYEARRLGRYRLKSPLGIGGMNEIWLAWDDVVRRDVALKVLRAGPEVDQARWRRFEREAQATSALVSPHTVRIYDYGASDDGIAYIAMEYLRGQDLDTIVRGTGAMPLPRAVHLVAQACQALAEAHRRGLIHRDVKPANLFALSSPGHEDFLKVLDFGVVRELGSPSTTVLTQAGAMVGTPAFMAPEAFVGDEVTAAADVYGLGATLYFLLTGVPPFAPTSDVQLWHAHTTAPVVPAAERRGGPVPAALEAILARCLAKHPVDRYPDAGAVEAALALVRDAEDVAAWTAVDGRRWWAAARLEGLGEGSPLPSDLAPTVSAQPRAVER